MLTFISKVGTYAKKSLEQSSKLPQGQKRYYPSGSEVKIESIIDERRDHLSVRLAYGQGDWYLFAEHWELLSPRQNSGLSQAVQFLFKHEGLRLEAYPDPLHRWEVPTIGLGTTVYPNGQLVKRGDRITKEQAEAYAASFIEKELTPKLSKIPNWGKMNANQRIALYSFGYNLGPSFYGGRNFASITAVCDSPHRWNDKTWVAEQFVKYRNPGSNVEEGLRKRRIDEARLFCTPEVLQLTPALPPIPISRESTQLELNISGSVGWGGQNKTKDVILVRHRLRQLGYSLGLSESTVDYHLIQAIKLFQSIIQGSTRLSGDGRIDVDGFTHRWINRPNAPRWVRMTEKSPGLINVEALETWDQHDYGTDWLDQALIEISANYEKKYRQGRNNVSLIQVNDVSLKHGGDTPDHLGHETGMCADLRLPSSSGGPTTIVQSWRSSDYHRTAALEQVKAIKSHPLTKAVYFNDPEAIRLGLCNPRRGHDNHIHVEIKAKNL